MDLRTALEIALTALVTGGSLVVIPRSVIRNKRKSAAEVAAVAARKGRRTAKGKARVVECTPTGWTINDMPQLELSLELEVEGRTIRFGEKILVNEGTTFEKGDAVAVTFDPLDPANVEIDA